MVFERWCTVLAARLRALFAGGTLDRDLDDELRYHLDRLVETNVAKGLSPDAARCYQDYERFSTGLSSIFSGMYATTWADAYNVQSAGHVDEGLARVSVVTGNFFNVLGARIEQGRARRRRVRLHRSPVRSDPPHPAHPWP